MPGSNRKRRLREQKMVASLDMICFLGARQCRAIASAALHLQRDPIYEDVLGNDAVRFSSASKLLLEESTKAKGYQVLRLAVARRLLLEILERKEVVIWLGRDHPETLSILMNSADFNGLGWGDIDDVPTPPRARKRRDLGGGTR